MRAGEQLGFLELFETAKPANPLLCHQDFLEKLAAHGRDAIGRRATLLMQRLAVDARRQHYKPTQGANRGWRRSRLGGNGGSHFYAWWAPKDAAPLRESGEFASAPEGALVLRDIRHHDDHSPVTVQSYAEHYLPLGVRDLRREEYGPAPWTQPQAKFASARQAVRILKGHPGSGKTTSLWHAADLAPGGKILYATFSRDLAALARDYFDRYCSSHKKFHVVVFPTLIRELLGADIPFTSEAECRKRFASDIAPFKTTLGPWAANPMALYDELHAHMVGDALPVAAGRFAACPAPRVPDRAFRDRRGRSLGPATAAAADAVIRLERLDKSGFAERYCPELALAWRAAKRMETARDSVAASGVPAQLLDFDCIAVDECQDLTPIEAFVLIELAAAANLRRVAPVQLLLAGDEAQTVRAADFEWGWLNDLLHARVGTPSEHKLASNLRSPRRIAELVNRVWDLYSQIDKRERPSGAGHAEIDDDATDQILYCSAVPGRDLDELVTTLAAREGLALITLEDAAPPAIPEAARQAVLTVAEAKGLDFHSVCVLDAGRHIDRILRENTHVRASADIEGLRKRLAIDQLRVALSRPTERLIWLDISPTDKVVRQSVEFLNGGPHESGVSSCVPSALTKTLEEDQLDPEERIQRCQTDARQYLEVRPEMAWSRAQQAVTLLGRPGSPAAIESQSLRDSTYLTLAEICFCLGIRNASLPPELGRPDLFDESHSAAMQARRLGLAAVIRDIGRVHHAAGPERVGRLGDLAQTLPRYQSEVEPWLLVEVGPKAEMWTGDLERAMHVGHNASVLVNILPPFYGALGMAGSAARGDTLRQRALQFMMKEKQYGEALGVLRKLPERQPKLEAACHEGLGDFRAAAGCYREAGGLKEALQCYRSIPDFDTSLALLRELGDHPAAASLEWVARMRTLVEERPEKFGKVMTTAEKKILEELLERSLGVTRRKPAAKKVATKKASTPRKRAPYRPAPRRGEPF